ncbi:MAG: hypothetical protein L3J11_11550 [Draconibacterium sp.]|nr:hypothetical protein [Draconibacterium sp.]
MKTRKLTAVLLTFIVAIVIISCNKDKLSTPGVIQFNAISQSSGVKSATIETTAGEINLLGAVVEIKNLQIEENSGNDNGGNNQDGNSDSGKDDGKENGSKESDGGDIVLAGPYVLDITGGTATIDQIEAQPGTYKKVNFDFVATAENSGNSIALSGDYKSNAGYAIPFFLTSNIEANVQLPLVSGITVNTGNTVSVSIVFDVNGWLKGLDFENAATTIDGKIVISKTQNTNLYNAFIQAVSKNIEIE